MKILNLFILTMILTTAVFADIPSPEHRRSPKPTPSPAQGVSTRAYIVLSKQDKTPRLVIPKDALEKLLSEGGTQSIIIGQIEDSNSNFDFSRAQAIFGGLFLSLAFVLGGVWLARTKGQVSKTTKSAAFGALLFLSGIFVTVAVANVGPPVVTRSITSRLFDKDAMRGKQAYGEVRIEASEGSGYVYLYVPDVGENKASGEE